MKALTPRFPHLLHGGDYNPEQWLAYPDVLEKDIELMKKAHVNCVSLGIFAWSHLEPEEGVYDFSWLEMIIERLYKNGIYTILATPSGARPRWMAQKYPEVLRVADNGVRNAYGDRHNHCLTSPIYREKVKQMNTRLAQHFAGNPAVILWHISNEYSGACYCPLCRKAFTQWVKQKYGTLENLNHAWWADFWSHTYTSWDQVEPPLANGDSTLHGLNLDWKRFTTDQTVDFMREEIRAVKQVNPTLPVTANLMGFFDGLDYFRFGDDLDVISWDNYPCWHQGDNMAIAAQAAASHDLMRSIKRAPWLLMESTPSMTNWQPVSKLKRPGMHELSSLQAVAHGAQSVQYFQWRKSRGSFEKLHGAVVDHNGEGNTRVFHDVEKTGEWLQRLDEKIYPTRVQPKVAIVYDWENRWAVEDAKGPRNGGLHYLETVLAHHRALWEKGIATDLIDMTKSLDRYKLVIAPMNYLYRKGYAEALRNFVKNGGTLVGTYWSGIVDDTDLCCLGGVPGQGMMEVFGIWNEETDALYDGETNTLVPETTAGFPQKAYEVSELCALVHAQGAQVLATYGSDFYQGTPALTVHAYGKGQAYYVAARTGLDFLRDFYETLRKELALPRALHAEFPAGVVATRRQGDENDFVFLQNYGDTEQIVQLPAGMTDALTGEPVNKVQLSAYGISVLQTAGSGISKWEE